MIMEGEHDDFGAEKLKGLMKILPEMVTIQQRCFQPVIFNFNNYNARVLIPWLFFIDLSTSIVYS